MILEAICRGNFTPTEDVYPEDPAYKKANDQVCDLMEELRQKLPPEQYTILEKLMEHDGTMHCLENEAYFKLGLSAGLQIQKEAKEQLKYLER